MPDARILVLGSMPGIASLEAGQYYAHPQNLFWRFIATITGTDVLPSYEERLGTLKEQKIALWDVLQSCIREGSLDSAIKDEIPNDLAAFLQKHPRIEIICFNGGKAEQSFRRHFRALEKQYKLVQLPSTSPANASIPYDKKLAMWRETLSL